VRILSLGGSQYGPIIVSDYSRYIWVFFLVHKSESFHVFEVFCKRVQKEKNYYISSILSDHETKFENGEFQMFCESNGIHHNFSSPRTPQQNVGCEKKENKTLQEMVRTMFCENSIPEHF